LQQPFDLARFGVAVGGELRVEQLAIDRELKTTAIGRDEGERFDLGLEFPD